jgi:prepilin-type N-terminal cleavage/methylation domain-containing protein
VEQIQKDQLGQHIKSIFLGGIPMKAKGFTLIELMVVIGIIAILAAIASVKLGSQLSKAKDGKAVATVGSWRSANHLNYADTSEYAITFSELQSKVDNQTVNLTYADVNKTPFTGGSQQFTQAGRSSNTNNMVSFTITGSALESAIEFDVSNGTDTKEIDWSSY